jgi:hypothetical protein
MPRFFKHLAVIAIAITALSCNHSEKDTIHDHDGNEMDTSLLKPASCKMQLTWDNKNPSTGSTVNFRFTPLSQPGNKIASLELLHQKKIHFIIVNEDLSYFDHLHLDKDSAGSYNIAAFFPAGGKYMLIADYKPERMAQQYDTFSINVAGNSNKPVTYTASQLTTTTDGYTVQLLHKKLIPNTEGVVVMKISKDGNNILPEKIQQYLGEAAHMIAINTDSKEYVHTHSMSDPMSYWFMAKFPRAGFYKVWVQFQTNDMVHTAPFVIQVDNTK